jgi:hypothetical protein
MWHSERINDLASALMGTCDGKTVFYIKRGLYNLILSEDFYPLSKFKNNIHPLFPYSPGKIPPHALSDCVSGHLMLYFTGYSEI